jgi:hypothetical protein
MARAYEQDENERRTTDRFPIETGLRYKLIGKDVSANTGSGLTLNMSSSGILFTTPAPLPAGDRVQVSVDWPASLSEQCGLTLVAQAKIVRSSENATAVVIEKYDFRTRATAGLKPVTASAS